MTAVSPVLTIAAPSEAHSGGAPGSAAPPASLPQDRVELSGEALLRATRQHYTEALDATKATVAMQKYILDVLS